MKRLKLTHILAALAVLALTVFAAAACGDDDEDNGSTTEIAIMEPFGRVTLDTASAYFTIKNNGDTDDALIKASAPVAGMAGLHVMLEELTQDLEVGDTYTLTLEFESGLTMDVEITVESFTEDGGMDEGGM